MKQFLQIIWSKEFLIKILLVFTIANLIKLFILFDDIIAFIRFTYPYLDLLSRIAEKAPI